MTLASWLFIVVLLVAMILLGLPAWFSALKQVCTGTSQDCQGLLQLSQEQAARWPSLDAYAWYNVITRGLARLFSFVLGVLIYLRKPNSRIAWVTSIFLIVGIESGIGNALAAAHPFWQAPNLFLGLVGELSLVLFAMLFPNDRFEPGWTRWLIIPWAFASIANYALSHTSTLGVLLGLFDLLFILLLIGILIYRYRKAFSYVDRQKAKWVIYAFVIGFSLFVSGIGITIALFGFESPVMSLETYILQDFLIVGVLDYLLPTSMAISILRYQLFDIDVIIRKTLVYTAITSLLVLTYFGSVAVLQAIFSALGSVQSPLVTVISTLVIAAIFSPLRSRIQELIDRRFYRRKYDAVLALANFAAYAQNQTDLRSLTQAIQSVVRDALQPELLSVWIRPKIDKGVDKPG